MPPNKTMKFAKKTDIIIIAILIIICFGAFFIYRNATSSKDLRKAEIYEENKLIKTIILDENSEETFSAGETDNVIFHKFKDGTICFESSDCPDKVCVNMGKLSRIGESAACLPNKLVLKIVSADGETEHDIVL